MAGWPWPLTSWVAPLDRSSLRRCAGSEHPGRTAAHRGICREMGEAGGELRLGPGRRLRVQPSRPEKSTANRPKSVNSSMATAHSQAAAAERSGHECRTTTSHGGQGPRHAGRTPRPLSTDLPCPVRNGPWELPRLSGPQTPSPGCPPTPVSISGCCPCSLGAIAFPTFLSHVLHPWPSLTPLRLHHHHPPTCSDRQTAPNCFSLQICRVS